MLTERNNRLVKEADKVKAQCDRERVEQIGVFTTTIEHQRQEIAKLKEV